MSDQTSDIVSAADSRSAAAEAVSLAARAEVLAREAAAAALLGPQDDETEAAAEARLVKADAAVRKAKYLAAKAEKFAEEAQETAQDTADAGAAQAARTARADAAAAKALAAKAARLVKDGADATRSQVMALVGSVPADAGTSPGIVVNAGPEGARELHPVVFPELPKARMRGRHWTIIAAFVVIVLVPTLVSAWYLWTRAADQYASHVGFLVRSEQSNGPLDALGGLAQLAQATSSDTDILYKFIQSQSLVEEVAQRIDLSAIWSRHPEDIVFNYDNSPLIEDLVRHWNRMVTIYYDKGMLDLRVLASTPEDAKAIAELILEESQKRLNEINTVARADAMRYAQGDLDRAVAQLTQARQDMSAFRQENRIIDPTSATTEQAAIVARLEEQLVQALVDLDVLRANSTARDQRLVQAELRVTSLRDQIEEQRRRVGSRETDAADLSNIVSDFERLQVNREFAEQSYMAAMTNFETARAAADRQALYLAAYIRPTLATTPEYPQRVRMMVTLTAFLLLVWAIGSLFYYGSRDRRS